MDDLLQIYSQLSETQRRQLLAYADSLLLHQKARKSEGNLSVWKEKIKTVSTWSEKDILAMEQNSKGLNNWKIPEW
ncbi:MAG: hypothetical protein ABIN80_18230 [Dyadobacter sp.]|uniref:hypothetical protein n=1 Tax=Dyadobacter sp. TaxID=1914288 RepID=UPI003264D8A9